MNEENRKFNRHYNEENQRKLNYERASNIKKTIHNSQNRVFNQNAYSRHEIKSQCSDFAARRFENLKEDA